VTEPDESQEPGERTPDPTTVDGTEKAIPDAKAPPPAPTGEDPAPAGEDQPPTDDESPPPTPPQQNPVAAALAAAAPSPTTWAQKAQMGIAFIALTLAFGLAFVLVLKGPPSPKAATVNLTEKTENESGETTAATTRTGVVGAQLATATVPAAAPAGEEAQAEGEGGEEGTIPAGGATTASAGEASEGGEEGESLANLSKQGPWAFAIVALLVAAFVATGKSLSVVGTKSGSG
jgi:hypothetical protein